MTVRDDCPMTEKTLSPTLTDRLNDLGDECFAGPSQGSRDIYSLLRNQPFMAVWTFVVPANQCFRLKFVLNIRKDKSDYYEDRLTILDGDFNHPIALKSGPPTEYNILPQNDTTTVSVVYFYTSLSRSVYLRLTPSLMTSDCSC